MKWLAAQLMIYCVREKNENEDEEEKKKDTAYETLCLLCQGYKIITRLATKFI